MVLARFIAGVFSRWRSRFSSAPEPGENPAHWLGRRGEALAARHLRRNGHKVLYRNFRPKHGGEIDLVCRNKVERTLVFVEVKSRTSEAFGRPADAVDREKQRHISKGALAWLRLLDKEDILFRFDIVEVILADGRVECRHLRNAFPLTAPYRWP